MNWFGWFWGCWFSVLDFVALDLGAAAVGLAVLLHGRRFSVCFRGCEFAGSGLVLCLVVFMRWAHWLVGLARCVCVLVVAVTFVSWV